MGLEGSFSREPEGGLEKGLQGGLQKKGLLFLEGGFKPFSSTLEKGERSEGLQGDLTRENLRRKLEVPSQNK